MNDRIAQAVALLRSGELVAFPTETVYGLGADARNAHAVAKIFAAKGRPADHPLIVHLPDASHLASWTRELPAEAMQLARAFWPGPLTLILKRAEGVPDAVTGGQDTVGVRVPNHPLALELLRTFDGGIAAPSANRFGRISPTTAAHVREELGDAVPLVLDGGACEVGIESTILDLSRGRPVILRPGAISRHDIARVIGRVPELAQAQATQSDEVPREGTVAREAPREVISAREAPREAANAREAPRVSGTLAAHYAPRTALQLVASDELAARAMALVAQGPRVAVLGRTAGATHSVVGVTVWRAAANDPARYAHDLYANLRDLDHAGCDIILVEAPPAIEAWRAVADRLQRAATGSDEADET